jgi:stalled ribosome alternative rescue factor ArfA
MFEAAGIRVIKLGLHASETTETDMLGGLYHPAFREIVEGILFRREMEKRIKEKGSYRVYAAPNAVSKAAGNATYCTLRKWVRELRFVPMKACKTVR